MLIKGKKIIVLRDSSIKAYWPECFISLQNLGFKFSFPDHSGFSFQGDGESCHLLAILILKDITKDLAEQYIQFHDNYTMLPHQLKYCQQQNHAKYFLKNGELYVSFLNSKGNLKTTKQSSTPITLADYIGYDHHKRANNKWNHKLHMIAANPPRIQSSSTP